MTSSLPLVSVVTPSYNQAQFLEETMRSVLEQDYPRIEYIVMDGGSTDGSQEIIRRYESKLAYWSSGPDEGQADAINKGWLRSTGDIVAYLNSDDSYVPGAVRKAVEFMQQETGAGMIYGHCLQTNPSGKVVGVLRGKPTTLRDLLFTNVIIQPTVFIRRACLERVGLLDPRLSHAMDYDLWLRISLHYPLALLDEPLACFRAHASSKSFSSPGVFLDDIAMILAKLFSDPDFPSELRVVRSEALARHTLTVSLLCYAANQKETSRELICRAIDEWSELLDRERLLVERIAHTYVSSVRTPWLGAGDTDPVKWVDSYLEHLPPRAARLRKSRGRILAKIHAVEAWEAYASSDMGALRRHTWLMTRHQPRSLFDRGMLSLLFKSLRTPNPRERVDTMPC